MPDPGDTDNTIALTPNDLCGIIQRMLSELNAYLTQHPAQVDPAICMSYLERCATFVGRLPRPQAPAANGNEKVVARKN